MLKSTLIDKQGGIRASKEKSFLVKLIFAAINLIENPFGAFLFGLVGYLVTASFGTTHFSVTDTAYFNYLSSAFLNGKLYLVNNPPSTLDLVLFQNHYYLYWSPFPAILLTPFIAIFGNDFSDVLFNVLIASLNVGLVAQLLRVATTSGIIRISKELRAILVVFFAFGTVHYPLAPIGKAWMTSQLVSFTCVVLAYISSISYSGKKAWLFTGLSLSCAMLTRNHLVFTGIFPFMYLLHKDKDLGWPRLGKNFLLSMVPLVISISILFAYNYARFGNPFENGIQYHLMNDFFRNDYEQYGMFNLHYIPINLYFQYIFYPFPWRAESPIGGSLFLMSPLFFGLFTSKFNARKKWEFWALVGSIIITNIPILLLMGTGFYQYGPRYTLDFTVPLLLLTAIGIEKWKPSIILLLTLISIFHYSVKMYYWVTV